MSINFWSEAQTEPKRKFRYLLYFAGAPQFLAKTVSKPSFQVGTTTHNFLQHQFHFPGRVTWQDVQMTLVDPIQPDSTATLYEILRASGYVLPPDVMDTGGLKTVSKKAMVTSLDNHIDIETIGPGGADEVIESWRLNNPLITSVNFDTLDYSTDELLNIQITIKYDWATLNDSRTVTLHTSAGRPWKEFDPK
jgi:hypothetical protein